MKLILRGLLAATSLLLVAIPAFAQAPAPPLSIGFASIARPRLPLEEFARVHPEFAVTEVPWGRNVLRWFEPPLPQTIAGLPAALLIVAGRGSEDLRVLAERRLLAPVAPVLADIQVDPGDYPAPFRDAFTYDGTLYALPHHVVLPVLRFHRKAFADAQLTPGAASWEELLDGATPIVSRKGSAGMRRIFSAPYSTARLAEFIALSTGEAPLDLANPSFVRSEGFKKAIRFVVEGVASNRIFLRRPGTPVLADAGIVYGLDLLSNVLPENEYDVAELPTKINAGDSPAGTPRVPALVEGLALRNYSPDQKPAVTALARWLCLPETEWRVFELSNVREPSREVQMDSVHFPLRASTRTSVDFEYGFKKFPNLAVLGKYLEKAYIPRTPADLDARVWELVEANVDYLKKDDDIDAALAELETEIRTLVRTTPVESAAYAEY